MFGSLFPVCFVASPAKVATVRLGTIIIVRRKSIRCSASSSLFHAGPAHLFGLAFFKYISIQIFFFFLIKRSRKSCLNPIGRLVFLSSGLREISQSRRNSFHGLLQHESVPYFGYSRICKRCERTWK